MTAQGAGSPKPACPPPAHDTPDDGSPGSDAWIPRTPWHELRTVIGKEGPVEAPVASLRDLADALYDALAARST